MPQPGIAGAGAGPIPGCPGGGGAQFLVPAARSRQAAAPRALKASVCVSYRSSFLLFCRNWMRTRCPEGMTGRSSSRAFERTSVAAAGVERVRIIHEFPREESADRLVGVSGSARDEIEIHRPQERSPRQKPIPPQITVPTLRSARSPAMAACPDPVAGTSCT